MRRPKLIAAVAGLAVVIAVGMFVSWSPPARITEENCSRIREDMILADVVAILGPPGDYRTEITPAVDLIDLEHPHREDWLGNEGVIFVFLDNSGHVKRAQFYRKTPLRRAPLDDLLWRAKRLWRRWFPD
jgi:hypothetical protein